VKLPRAAAYGLVCGGLLALFLLAVVLGSLGCATTGQAKECEWEAGEPENWQPDYERAQKELIPWNTSEDDSVIYAWVHEWTCCDCGLVHRMLFVPVLEGLAIYLWRLDLETRKERARRGMVGYMTPLRGRAEDREYENQE